MPQPKTRMPPFSMLNMLGKMVSILRSSTMMMAINSSSVLQGTTVAIIKIVQCRLEMILVEHGPIFHFATKNSNLSMNKG